MFSLDSFVVKANIKIDESNKYDNYERLNFAEIACEKDSHCIGIYDASCDQNGPFELLVRGFMTSNSMTSDCIYAKKRHDGE